MAIAVSGKFVPKNNGTFPIVDADYVAYKDGMLPEYMFVCLTQEEYDALARSPDGINPKTPYIIIDKRPEEAV